MFVYSSLISKFISSPAKVILKDMFCEIRLKYFYKSLIRQNIKYKQMTSSVPKFENNFSHPVSLDTQKTRVTNKFLERKVSYNPVRNKRSVTRYTKAVPKQNAIQVEDLYSQNIQLKQKINFLEEMNVKLKSKINHHKQKEDLSTNDRKSIYQPRFLNSKPSHKNSLSVHYLHKNQEDRRILHEYKQKVTELQKQNKKLRKQIKYTDLREVDILNKELQNQISRLLSKMDSLKYQAEESQNMLLNEIDLLNRDIKIEKQNNKSMFSKLKKKDEEISEIALQFQKLSSRKGQVGKKLRSDIRKLERQLAQSRERQKFLYQNYIGEKQKEKEKPCDNCKKYEQQIIELYSQLQRNEQQRQELEGIIDKENFQKELLKEEVETLMQGHSLRINPIQTENSMSKYNKNNSEIINEKEQQYNDDFQNEYSNDFQDSEEIEKRKNGKRIRPESKKKRHLSPSEEGSSEEEILFQKK